MKRFYRLFVFLIALNCFVALASAQFVEWDPVLDRELNIPDPNLRAAIEELLDDSITPRSMERIIYFRSAGRSANISNLTGLEWAVNLQQLDLYGNKISDISPLRGLGRLRILNLRNNQISDISPLRGLINLTHLYIASNQISDISPLQGLINLEDLIMHNNRISDISPLKGLINLEYLHLGINRISNLSPLTGLVNLRNLYLSVNRISDISPLIGLINLTRLHLGSNRISNLSPLTGLINIGELYLRDNKISDISPLLKLKNPTHRYTVHLGKNQISDRSALAKLIAHATVYFSGNPAFDTPGPKIEGPWLWLAAPTGLRKITEAAASERDFLSEVSGGSVTEADIASNGATAGTVVGDSKWTHSSLAPTGDNNFTQLANALGLVPSSDILVLYGFIFVESPKAQETWLYIGTSHPAKVWLNGELVHVDLYGHFDPPDYKTAFPVKLKAGENRLLVANYGYFGYSWHGFFGFEDGTDYTVPGSPQTPMADADGDKVTEETQQTPETGDKVTEETQQTPETSVLVNATELPPMFWINSESSTLYRLIDDEVQPLLPNVQNATSLAVDVPAGKLYWSEKTSNTTGRIRRANIDGTNVRLVKDLTSAPHGIALDPAARKIYLTNAWGKVQRVNLDGSDFQPNLITELDTPGGLALDVSRGKVYWTEMPGRIRRANLDGSNVEDVATGLGMPINIAISGDRIYWTEKTGADTGEIRFTNLRGNPNVMTRHSFPQVFPVGLAVDAIENKLYWTTSRGKIGRSNFDGSNFQPNLVTGLSAPGTLVLNVETPVVVETPEILTTDAVLSISPSPVISPTIGEQLTLNVNIADGEAVAGYQVTVQFDPTALRYVESSNGDYLPAGVSFVPPVINGNRVKLAATTPSGVSKGNGTLATLTFEVVAAKASTLRLSDVLLSNREGNTVSPEVEGGQVTEPPKVEGDVNEDGVVNIQDLVSVASNLGKTGQNVADVNGDEIVDIRDLVKVAGALGNTAAAPSLHPHAVAMFTATDVQKWLLHAQHLDLTDITSQRGIHFLEQLLATLIPKDTVILPNYPNPFNPETWIPYQLATAADVQILIYDMRGIIVRRLALGHQLAGYYTAPNRAAYWDGRNSSGERVASGVYFYQLLTNEASSLRKMVILK